jgi:hypothetical protein
MNKPRNKPVTTEARSTSARGSAPFSSTAPSSAGPYQLTQLGAELAEVLTTEQELFASEVAGGRSYREAAATAGFNPDYGFQMMKMPRIRARVQELLAEPDERIRARVNAEFILLLNRVSSAEPYDPEVHLKVLLALAKYKGWVIDKKQISKLGLNMKVSRADLDAVISEGLGALAPGEQARIRRLAAGELGQDDKSVVDAKLAE